MRSFSYLRSSVASMLAVCVISAVIVGPSAQAAGFQGQILDEQGQPIVGAMVTARFNLPFQERTVFTDDLGNYVLRGLPAATDHTMRVRRIGWHDVRSLGHNTSDDTAGNASNNASNNASENELIPLSFTMQRHTDPAEVAAQLPANHWYELLLNELDTDHEREQFVRQCTYCHQQGNAATRLQRDEAEWDKVLALMARMGAGLDEDLHARIPALFNKAYDPATAVPALTKGWQEPGFAPPPSEHVR